MDWEWSPGKEAGEANNFSKENIFVRFFLPERSKFDSIYLWSNMVGFQNTLVVRCDKGSERGVSWVVSNS